MQRDCATRSLLLFKERIPLFSFLVLLCLIFFGSPAYSESLRFEKPSHIDQEVWDCCAEYFIPVDHPAKRVLDEIFGMAPRAIQSSKSLRKAGFKNTKPGKWSGTIVTRHKKLKGYLVKLFTDEQTQYIDSKKLIQRAEGARSVRATVDRLGWGSIFKVPQKWIYPLPAPSGALKKEERKNFILLVEDMDLMSETENLSKWASDSLPRKTLKILHQLLDEEGLSDSVYAFNLPFAKDGRIALIDLEQHHRWPIPYHKLCKYLSTKNSLYWKSL